MQNDGRTFSKISCKVFTYGLCVMAAPCIAQTRIATPQFEYGTYGRDDENSHSQRATWNAEAPIPVAARFAMPFVHLYESGTTKYFDDSQVTFLRDQRIFVGLLHHADEGAPLWKWEIGRWGEFGNRGYMLQRASFNIEKIMPFLRPFNSDKLDSWIGVSTISGQGGVTYALPQLGWSWASSGGWIIDMGPPEYMRVGLKDGDWTAALSLRNSWTPQEDDSRAGGIRVNIERLATLEAIRELPLGWSTTLSAGMKLPQTPYAALALGWRPQK